MTILRCGWVSDDSIDIEYHDKEWGVPLHDERQLFEFLILEGVQAGLSWSTVLRKRNNYRQAFDNFDPVKIARYSEKKIAVLMNDAGLIRNRLKMNAAVTNAKAFLLTQKEFGSFDNYIWSFVYHKTMQNKRQKLKDIPTCSKESDMMSKDLKRRGFKFVGSTICYAFMQATGMINDHTASCFRHKELLSSVVQLAGIDLS